MYIEILNLKVNNLEHTTNSYIIYNENRNAVLIDPADEKEKIISKLEELSLNLKCVIITHAHADHIGALSYILKKYNVKAYVHKSDIEKLNDMIKNCANILDYMLVEKIELDDVIEINDEKFNLEIGNMKFNIFHTPGHTSGSICIYESNSKALFSGDTIFSNCYGRCDLYSSSLESMVDSLRVLFDELKFNESDIVVYPGHGESALLKEAKKRIKMLMKLKNKVDL